MRPPVRCAQCLACSCSRREPAIPEPSCQLCGFKTTKPAHPEQRRQRSIACGGLNRASLPWTPRLHRVCPAHPSPWEQRQRVQRDGPVPSPGWGSWRREFCVRTRPFPFPFASAGARALWLGGWDAQNIQENKQKPPNVLGSTPILTGRAWWSPCVQREVSKLSQLPGHLAHCLARLQGAPRPTWAKPVWPSVLSVTVGPR